MASLPPPERTSHPYLTYDMIRQIPEALAATLRKSREALLQLAPELQARRFFYFTGCGTALYASMHGAQMFSLSKDGGVNSTAVSAFELSRYREHLPPRSVAIGVSHSGITKTTLEALEHCRRRGAFTVGVTHHPGRPIEGAADRVLVVGNGPDLSRCHTKCYVAGALACSLLAAKHLKALEGEGSPRLQRVESEISALPGLCGRTLRETEKVCKELAGRYLDRRRYYFVAHGPNLPTAFEAALKMKETSYVAAEGVETERFIHGEWLSVGPDALIVLIAPRGPGHERSGDLAEAVKAVGATTLAVVEKGDRRLDGAAEEVMEIEAVDELLSPYLAVLPLYFFAYYSSVKRGYNPDYLRYLTPPYWKARNILFPPGTH